MMHFLRQLLLVLPARAWISNNSFWIFVGDSTTRFQYLTLAYYLRTGNWSVPSGGGGGNLTGLVNEHQRRPCIATNRGCPTTHQPQAATRRQEETT